MSTNEQAHSQGELEFQGVLDALRDPDAFRQYLQPLRHNEWVVYMKPPFGNAEDVIDYLGRYTHRVPEEQTEESRCDGLASLVESGQQLLSELLWSLPV